MKTIGLKGPDAKRNICFAFILITLLLCGGEALAQLVVTSTADSGSGSIRSALIAGNTSPPPVTITFNIAPTGIQTISLLSALPSITNQVTIDATTESGFAGTPVIWLDGSHVTNGSGLTVSSTGSVISGLGLVNFWAGHGLQAFSAQSLIVSNSYVTWNRAGGIELNNCTGTVVANTVVSSNGVAGSSPSADGVSINGGSSNRVEGCAIVGNTGNGVTAAANDTVVSSNRFGVSLSGTNVGSPQASGVYVPGATRTFLWRNLFAGDYAGVIVNAGTNTIFKNNTFGYLSDEVTPANLRQGIFIYNGSCNTCISCCDFGNAPYGNIQVGYPGDTGPFSRWTRVSDCVFGANANTGFAYLRAEFRGGPANVPALMGPGCSAPAVYDYNGVDTVCVNNLAYNNTAACFQAASGVNTTFDACLSVGASSGICISTADDVPAPVISQAPNTGSSVTPTVSLTGAQSNSIYTVWFAWGATNDNEVPHYLGTTTVTTDGTGSGTSTATFPATVPAGAYAYGVAIAPDHATSLRSSGTMVAAAPQLVLAVNYLPIKMTSGDAPGTFAVTVTNSGMATATNVILAVCPTPLLSITDASGSQGTVSNANNGALCQVPTLAVGSNASLYVVYQPCVVQAPAIVDYFTTASADNAPGVSASVEILINPLTINVSSVQTGAVQVTVPFAATSLLEAPSPTSTQWQIVPNSMRVTGASNYIYTLPTTNHAEYFRASAPPAPQPATSVFYQAWPALDGAPPVSASGVGVLEIQLASNSTNYVNLVAGPPGTNNLTTNDWVIINLPVPPTNSITFSNSTLKYTLIFYDELHTNYWINFTNLFSNSLEYSFTLTTNLLSTPVLTNTNVVKIYPYPIIFNHGIQTNSLMIFTNQMAPLVGGSVVGSAYAQTNFPDEEQGTNECVPAGLANSLEYLNANFNLNMAASNISVAALKPAVHWTSGGAPANWVSLKRQYMTNNSLPIVTDETTNVPTAMTALNNTNDVEIWMTGHLACVVGIQDLGGGQYTLEILHDVRQGQFGGTIIQIITLNASTGVIQGLPWGKSQFVEFVIEHPPP